MKKMYPTTYRWRLSRLLSAQEARSALVGFEGKASSTISSSDFKNFTPSKKALQKRNFSAWCFTTLLSNVDAAMCQAKEAGRDNFQFFTADMNSRAHERLALMNAMRGGIARSEFYLLYQPQVDLQSGRIFAAEALVRWNHPTRGTIAPDDFIPLAEETGLIVSLGEWVLREACRQNKAWKDAGLPPITVCVNVSARQFNDNEWTSRVVRALEESGLQVRYLELELTESLAMRDVEQAIATMNELQALGVQFAIDDFGTGYSSIMP